jgi:hypothetical protein
MTLGKRRPSRVSSGISEGDTTRSGVPFPKCSASRRRSRLTDDPASRRACGPGGRDSCDSAKGLRSTPASGRARDHSIRPLWGRGRGRPGRGGGARPPAPGGIPSPCVTTRTDSIRCPAIPPVFKCDLRCLTFSSGNVRLPVLECGGSVFAIAHTGHAKYCALHRRFAHERQHRGRGSQEKSWMADGLQSRIGRQRLHEFADGIELPGDAQHQLFLRLVPAEYFAIGSRM